ncbi:unnamed protein product [Ranitomeya imitator]|uniref:Signal recognition particle SRP72 subunit RNA-binding domain-containing protein n=1 Tax=Ranitomeya imitator TaxID=111125 RepID=A0ABN9L6W1_9NEOB|nr:unnamed protein product [Ranitomeya imitator]
MESPEGTPQLCGEQQQPLEQPQTGKSLRSSQRRSSGSSRTGGAKAAQKSTKSSGRKDSPAREDPPITVPFASGMEQLALESEVQDLQQKGVLIKVPTEERVPWFPVQWTPGKWPPESSAWADGDLGIKISGSTAQETMELWGGSGLSQNISGDPCSTTGHPQQHRTPPHPSLRDAASLHSCLFPAVTLGPRFTSATTPSKLPKNYDPKVAPDPERWLPMRERSYYRGKKKGKKKEQIGKGTQGATSAVTAELDASKTASSPPTSPRPGVAATNAPSTANSNVVPPRHQKPVGAAGTKKKQQQKKKKGGRSGW